MIASRALVVLFVLLGPACFSPQGATSETSDPSTTTSTSNPTSTSTSTSETAPTSTVSPPPETSTTSDGTSSASSTSTTMAVSATTETTTVDATTTTTGDATTEPDMTSSSSSTTTTTTTGPMGECGNGVVDDGEECDDGNDDDFDACTSACTEPGCGDGILHANEECDEPGQNCVLCKRQWMQVFVTSTKSNGDLGGLEGADERCQNRADAAGLQGRFKAWIGTDGSPAVERLQQSLRPYKRFDGAQVAASWADLIDGILLNEINIDENGDPAAQAIGCGECQVWTATRTNGTAYMDHCNGWDFPGFVDARVGECSYKDMRWTDGCAALQCNQSARLYCLEQGLTP